MHEMQHETGGTTNRLAWASAGVTLARMSVKLTVGPGGAKLPLVWGSCRSSYGRSQHCMCAC